MRRDERGYLSEGVITLVVIVVLVAMLTLLLSITIVPAGHVKVLDVFGKVRSEALRPGFSLRHPLAKAPGFSVRTQELKEKTTAPVERGSTGRAGRVSLVLASTGPSSQLVQDSGPRLHRRDRRAERAGRDP